MVQQLPGGVIVLNSHCKMVYVNKFVCRYSELPERELLGKSFFSMFPEVPKAWFNRKIEAVLTQQTPELISWQQRLYLLKFPRQTAQEHAQRYMAQNCTLLPLRDSNSGELHLCLWIQDVSEQVRYHAQLLFTQQQLKLHERQDSLTGLMNRTFWQQQLTLEIARAERYERPLSLLLFNLDRFKAFNDQYSHQQGDMVLQSFAKMIAALLRDNDLFARFAGAEFALILPDTPLVGAIEVANRMKKQLAQQVLLAQHPTLHLTMSIGISVYETATPTDAFIQQAEQALYQAKCAGRDQTSVFTLTAKAG